LPVVASRLSSMQKCGWRFFPGRHSNKRDCRDDCSSHSCGILGGARKKVGAKNICGGLAVFTALTGLGAIPVGRAHCF